jgi:two-component system, LytTR family, response regulator
MIKAIIIEDEIKSLNNLKSMLSKHCQNVEVIGDAVTIKDGLELFDDPEMKPDVAFLDINLPDGLVFQLLEQLRPIDFEPIFVTAHNEFTKKACEYSSIGYIVKPIDSEELKQAVNRIRPHHPDKTEQRLEIFSKHYNNLNAFEKMSISALDGIYFVNIKDIVRFEAEDNYTHIFLNEGERLTASKTIKSYEEMLQSVNFYRVHKRHVINLNFMRKFVKGDGGYLIMDDGKKIEVSRRRRPAFMEQMRRLQQEL